MSQLAVKRGGRLLIAGSCTLDDGARGALLTLPGAFRLDVQVREDDLRVGTRNLSTGELHTHAAPRAGALSVRGDALSPDLRPYRHDTSFDVGALSVRVAIAVMRDRARGRSSFTAHAVIDGGG